MSGISGVGGTGYTGPVDEPAPDGEAPPAASAAVAARSGAAEPAASRPAAAATAARVLDRVKVGVLPDGKSVAIDPATGKFSTQAPGGRVTSGSLSLYQATELVAGGGRSASSATRSSGRPAASSSRRPSRPRLRRGTTAPGSPG